jgi:hypothetical protein
MRVALILAPALAAGCIAAQPSALTVVAEAARLEPTDASGLPWCPPSQTLTTSLVTTIDGVSAETGPSPGLEPSWAFDLLDADPQALEDGMTVDLHGRCDGGPSFSVGALEIHLPPRRIHDGAVIVVALGKVAEVRLRLRALAGGDGTYDDGTYDDGTYDDGTYDDGTYDDGTYDDGSYDDGGGDDGSDDSSDDG